MWCHYLRAGNVAVSRDGDVAKTCERFSCNRMGQVAPISSDGIARADFIRLVSKVRRKCKRGLHGTTFIKLPPIGWPRQLFSSTHSAVVLYAAASRRMGDS